MALHKPPTLPRILGPGTGRPGQVCLWVPEEAPVSDTKYLETTSVPSLPPAAVVSPGDAQGKLFKSFLVGLES